jgi:adenine-specific DNA-methyltransferase
LELTWTNKRLRLLAHEDNSYEWVSASDYRVAEVRLLHDVTTVGDVGKTRAVENLLIRGDALNVLTSLARLPEFASEYLGKMKLAYIDPPFNTQQAFEQYDDALEHSVWLTMMRDRLLQIKALLSPDGSVWVHVDDAEQHRARSVLDEVFGAENFVATVVWEKVYSPRMDAKQFSSSHDYIHIYSKQLGWSPNSFTIEPNLDQFPFTSEDGRRYRSDPLRKWGKNSLRQDRPNLWYSLTPPAGGEVWPIKPDGTEGNWRWSKDRYEQKKDEVDWLDKGNGLQPYVRQYAESSTTRPPETLWSQLAAGHNHEAAEELKRLLARKFATPKPERLLERIVHIATNPGDLVLDCFVGSGTTAAVAHKMRRKWVAVEREAGTIETFTLPRLRKVVRGEDPGGVTEMTGWTSGGGFRVLDVAPSMFEADGGLVFLADWMTNGTLAEATAAQLGFEYEETPPFAGRKGRTRLVAVDGVVNESVVRLIVSALPEGERVVVCGTGIDTDARAILRELRPGSTLRKIPSALLDEYRSARQLRLALSGDGSGPTAPNRPAATVKARV